MMLSRIAQSLPKFANARSRILCTRSFFSSSTSSDNKDGESQKPSETQSTTTSTEQKPEELEQKMRSLQDAYLETLASMENLRSRTKKEVENASLFAVQKFSLDILSVADTLEIAIETIKAQSNNEQQEPSAILEGVEMTLTQLLAVLKRNGIQAFNPLHERFDPNLQNALYEIPTAEYEPGIVLRVEKKGYLLHERLLRPASVGVSKAP